MRGNQNLQVEHFDLHDVDFYIVNFEKFTRMCKEKWFRGYSPGFPLIREVEGTRVKGRKHVNAHHAQGANPRFATSPVIPWAKVW
jgi:hypothetical protein